VSPDGRWTAEIADASEIAMGAPTSGTLRLSDGRTLEGCNPSMVWSTDSRFLAVPVWTRDRKQRLCLLEVPNGDARCAARLYRVLELKSFSDGVVEGIDSPIHRPRRVRVAVEELGFRRPFTGPS
jgi:hypothetical protein